MKTEAKDTDQGQPENGAACGRLNAIVRLLMPCPCGQTPTELSLCYNGQGYKWASACGNCCGEWFVEFRTDYKKIDSSECLELAIEAWNEAKRSRRVKENNWDAFVSECEPFFSKKFYHKGVSYILAGVLHADDDFYYVMIDEEQKTQLLSCVGSIEDHGFVIA